jgi:hypothetical protein
MKTSLNILSLIFAFSVPASLALESAGLVLPAGLNPLSALAGFCVSFVLLTVTSDYTRRSRRPALMTAPAPKAAHPLAA